MLHRLAVLATLLLPATALGQATPAEGGVKVYQSVLKSTVWVLRGDGSGSGSGTLIDRRRHLVLTNYHVVGDMDRAVAMFPVFRDGRPIAERDFYKQRVRDMGIRGRVVARDKLADLALIQIDRVPDGVQALPIANEPVSPGQTVHSVGNPGGSGALWVYTPGKVRQVYQRKWTAKAGRETLQFQARIIETDSPTNPGDSGGPLVNERAELVGVTQGGTTAASLLSTFIDATEVKRFLASQTVREIKAPGGGTAREPFTIRDAAKFFGPDAVRQANRDIAQIEHRYGRDLLIETYATPPAEDTERVKALKSDERQSYFRDWARKRARSEGVNGVVILISRNPPTLYVDVTESVKGVVTSDEEKRIRQALLTAFGEKRYDDGLATAVRLVREGFADQRP